MLLILRTVGHPRCGKRLLRAADWYVCILDAATSRTQIWLTHDSLLPQYIPDTRPDEKFRFTLAGYSESGP